MDRYTFDKDIAVYCVRATSFPEGILQSHQTLHSKMPYSDERKYFGISRPETGPIVYKAAASELTPGELGDKGLEKFIVRKGEYLTVALKDYLKDVAVIGKTFQQLLSQPDIDPNGYCLEWYVSNSEVWCMVPLK